MAVFPSSQSRRYHRIVQEGASALPLPVRFQTRRAQEGRCSAALHHPAQCNVSSPWVTEPVCACPAAASYVHCPSTMKRGADRLYGHGHAVVRARQPEWTHAAHGLPERLPVGQRQLESDGACLALNFSSLSRQARFPQCPGSRLSQHLAGRAELAVNFCQEPRGLRLRPTLCSHANPGHRP